MDEQTLKEIRTHFATGAVPVTWVYDEEEHASFMKRREELIGHLSLKEQDALESSLCERLDENGQHWTDETYLKELAKLA